LDEYGIIMLTKNRLVKIIKVTKDIIQGKPIF